MGLPCIGWVHSSWVDDSGAGGKGLSKDGFLSFCVSFIQFFDLMIRQHESSFCWLSIQVGLNVLVCVERRLSRFNIASTNIDRLSIIIILYPLLLFATARCALCLFTLEASRFQPLPSMLVSSLYTEKWSLCLTLLSYRVPVSLRSWNHQASLIYNVQKSLARE